MWISPRLVRMVSDNAHSRVGNAQWIKLQGVPSEEVAIMNICAPHASPTSCLLLKELIDNLP